MTRILTMVLLGGLVAWACGCEAPAPLGDGTDSTRPGKLKKQVPAFRLEQDGFAVLDFRALRDEYGMVSVVGEIRNVGDTAGGVELQATLRDGDDRATAVGQIYPASGSNIRPGETWPFSYSFGRQRNAMRAELRIVAVFRTADILRASGVP